MYTNFINILSDEIKKSGLSQNQFSKKVGVSNATITRYLKGQRSPTAEMLLQIACKLNVSTDYLLTGLDFAPDILKICEEQEESEFDEGRNIRLF